MSLESVRKFFAQYAPDVVILVTEASSATVAEAAAAHGVEQAQIAKTLSLSVGGRTFLVVTAGTARLDNRKVKETFGGKASMLGPEEVEAITGHPIGGVCPFGLAAPLPVYCDVSLKAFAEVVPAAGSRNSALRISPERMAELTGAEWVDVCRDGAPRE
ncbi:YbaK/EbsC family protein [Bradyrhizobium sp. LHD-71]|uniref:YbaK/EbsC family protein n=1 Tax=Bradyrhizobium sp. LHD-71 TaxID=3072141 RepID=UPI00280D2491|nr:YbaK/EbsC family protein [Bradyrhizobium sp. LHD-71]MDQ8728927.1 YbaK/EbsC family protein [Bradyrhizobium sp. LHD-71]